MNFTEQIAQEFVRNQTAVAQELLQFMRKQRGKNFRTGLLLTLGGYLLWRTEQRILRQGSEIRALRNELEEIRERE